MVEHVSALTEKPMHSAEAVATDLQAKVRAMADAIDRNTVAAWAKIARLAGLTVGQVKRLYYGEWRIIPAHVFIAITEAYRAHLDRAAARASHEASVYRALADEWDRTWPNG